MFLYSIKHKQFQLTQDKLELLNYKVFFTK